MFIEDIQPGDKVRFVEERQAYKVQARSDRYVVCNKPFNARKTTLYTIIDLKERVRGPENLVFGAGAETPEQCQEMVHRLEDREMKNGGPTEVSRRRSIPLKVETIIRAADRFCGFCNRTAEDGPCSMCNKENNRG